MRLVDCHLSGNRRHGHFMNFITRAVQERKAWLGEGLLADA